jgi:hypothetical protein
LKADTRLMLVVTTPVDQDQTARGMVETCPEIDLFVRYVISLMIESARVTASFWVVRRSASVEQRLVPKDHPEPARADAAGAADAVAGVPRWDRG